MSQRRLWTPEEDEIIVRLVKEHGTKKWTTVAEEMGKAMATSSRTSKQIRQRWHNHLDPTVSKKEWNRYEEGILFESHRLCGSRWKQIANRLPGRTDNHVKNYFYSTMRRALRRVNKFLGSKNSTTQMRTIRPSILSYLLDIADSDPQIRILVSRILEFSKLKPKKAGQQSLLPDKDRKNYQVAINRLMEINEIYAKKGSRKLNQKQNIRLLERTNCSIEASTTLKQEECLDRIEREESEELECGEKSWSNQDAESYHCQLMPEIDQPEYECELLGRKEQPLGQPWQCQGSTGQPMPLTLFQF